MQTKILFLLFLFFGFLSYSAKAQQNLDADTRREIQEAANWAATKLMNCCTTFSAGSNLKASVEWDNVAVSKLIGTISIPMRVSWNGGWTGTGYWLRGKLIINPSNGTKEWQKLNDSGGFSPGCSGGCIN